MSKATREFFENIKNSKVGQEVGRAFKELGEELKQQAAHGAHELAAGLFRSSDAFVMYPRQHGQRDDVEHGPSEARREQERGGMER